MDMNIAFEELYRPLPLGQCLDHVGRVMSFYRACQDNGCGEAFDLTLCQGRLRHGTAHCWIERYSEEEGKRVVIDLCQPKHQVFDADEYYSHYGINDVHRYSPAKLKPLLKRTGGYSEFFHVSGFATALDGSRIVVNSNA